VRADLDTLLIALYCAACALFPTDSVPKRGRPELITDNELLCLIVAQMLLQCPSDRVFLRRARRRLGHLFSYLLS
jgi:Transposase DDE domain